jgi:flagellar biosynthetic protein FliO
LPDQLFFDIVKTVVALAFIVGLVYGFVYLMKRLLPGVVRNGVERVDLFVVCQLSLGSRQKVCVVRVQDRTLVLGVSEGSITTLAELTADKPDAKKEADDPKIFAELLTWHKDGVAPEGPRVESPRVDKRTRVAAPPPEAEPADPDDRGDGPLLFPPGKRPYL